MDVFVAILKFAAVAGALAVLLFALVFRLAARDPDFWRKWTLPQHPQFRDTGPTGVMLGAEAYAGRPASAPSDCASTADGDCGGGDGGGE